jgi:hypothetical protein
MNRVLVSPSDTMEAAQSPGKRIMNSDGATSFALEDEDALRSCSPIWNLECYCNVLGHCPEDEEEPEKLPGIRVYS